jgi:2-polyprenyl-6-methoxyphenol hydroxylase-like FAD-dependent oxidoreductase
VRTLIVGAGIAGLTLAGLLSRQGQIPTVVDRRPDIADQGYGLALWPHGSRVLHSLGLHDDFVAGSEPMGEYVARDGAGNLLTASPMPASVSSYGHLGVIARSDLLGLLATSLADVHVRSGVTIERLTETGGDVEVGFDDGSTGTFDLVVGADGIHSRVRELLFGRIAERDTGWGCYVWWADRQLVAGNDITERWGAGSFLGTYPCRDRVCVILGAPLEVLRPGSPRGRTDRIAALLRPHGVPVADFLAQLPGDAGSLFLWRMTDVRSPRWVEGRIALVGDAAAAFLPTAGIGASMALESAAVLADELTRTDAAYLPNALALYERRRRKRVEAAQTQSRRLARLMFIRSRRLASLRNRALSHASMEQMVGPLIKDLREPI